jgi:hypothetical protein
MEFLDINVLNAICSTVPSTGGFSQETVLSSDFKRRKKATKQKNSSLLMNSTL